MWILEEVLGSVTGIKVGVNFFKRKGGEKSGSFVFFLAVIPMRGFSDVFFCKRK